MKWPWKRDPNTVYAECAVFKMNLPDEPTRPPTPQPVRVKGKKPAGVE